MSIACPSFGSYTGGIPELLNKETTFKTGSVDQICDLLMNINKEIMMNQAKINFNKAKEYDGARLDTKRNSFYEIFIANL